MISQYVLRPILCLVAIGLASQVMPKSAEAVGPYRQSYSPWSYNTNTTYYYSSYYYKPTVSYATYKHHYCIYYPTRPRYVYYYNPVAQTYWGRYDLKKKGYSMLEKKDRKKNLDDIPEDAFPKPGKMPEIPESEDKVRMKPIDPKSLPVAKTPEALPTK